MEVQVHMRELLTKAIYDIPGLLELQQAKGRTKIYEDIKAGTLKASKMGVHTIFFVEDVAKWLEKLREEALAQNGNGQGKPKAVSKPTPSRAGPPRKDTRSRNAEAATTTAPKLPHGRRRRQPTGPEVPQHP
jgi:hypothetical protein